MARGRRPAPAGIQDQKAAVRSKRSKPGQVAQVQAAAAPGPTPPAWLKSEGLMVWKRLAPMLASAKLLTAADSETFGRYCRNFARWLKMQKDLDENGETYTSESQHGTLQRVNPAFMVSDRIERQLLGAEDRFGLNPSERQRIMAARSQTGITGDLFGETTKPGARRRPNDPAASASEPAQPIESPIGLLN